MRLLLFPSLMALCLAGLVHTTYGKGAGVLNTSARAAGDEFLSADFEGSSIEEVRNFWPALEGDAAHLSMDGGALLINIPDAAKGEGLKLSKALPLEGIRGATLHLTARVRGENLSKKPNPWNGIKLMLPITSETQNTYQQVRPTKDGTFEWMDIGFVVNVPENAKSCQVVMGLERVTGKLWVDSVKVVILEAPLDAAAVVVKEGPAHKGHPLPRLRGAMVAPSVTEEDLRVLGQEWNANVIRWQLGGLAYKATGLSTPNYDKVLEDELAKMDRMLPVCEKYGMYVVIDMHSLAMDTFASTANQDRLVEVWKKLAARYKDNPVIWGYDIVNEPRLTNWKPGATLWNALAERVSTEIRKVDSETTIIIEPENMALPSGFETLRPVSVPNVVYSVHMYNPGQFTHNRVYDKKQPSFTYPGLIDGKHWDKAEMERNLQPVIEFQKKYNVHIYVGEFSAIRWSPGAANYFRDAIEIFEKHGWDWTYHAFREFHGWSLEHGSMDPEDKTMSATPTDRAEVVKAWFSKNQKPEWAGLKAQAPLSQSQR